MKVFAENEIAVIEKVCTELGGKTAKVLSDLSHDEPAWALATELEKLDQQLMRYGTSEDVEAL